ncbi:MAG: ATP-binding cassette domain-containing protein [Candidatus Bipolaricaulota bacterium]|nr:ATP-binding cassette domain-containing protein [Candidatus Bipolaricaulota bacterium]MCS7274567.1 ATP-binding cassette domain-containing protein [Candidatus Bipolaricaulota bacterium]MDW8111003.1 ATP-binding cassette domain-containing protein [Candidatus Bipolaricaulota bacterium]MDW8329837.1 ATP-binding cassette domain-containing protein [Candidatus Bipolaricaulota bacterium]
MLVQVSELRFTTPQGQTVLEDVHLRVEHGEWVCVVGPPGAGKSLLLKLLVRECEPQRGQILVDDKNITRLRPNRLGELRRRLGIVPQDPTPLQRTVFDALVFKLRVLGFAPDEAEERADNVLKLLQLVSDEDNDRLISELDAPQQKLCFLALAVCHDPVLLLFDEPFEGLSEDGAQRVLDGLTRLYEGKRLAILMATRCLSWAQRSRARLVYLSNGRVQDRPPACCEVT